MVSISVNVSPPAALATSSSPHDGYPLGWQISCKVPEFNTRLAEGIPFTPCTSQHDLTYQISPPAFSSLLNDWYC